MVALSVTSALNGSSCGRVTVPSGDIMLLSDEVQHLIRHALEKLPSQTREILIRSRFKGQSNRTIAAEFGISVKAVEYHVTKALKALRKALGDYYFYFFLFC